MLFKRKSKEIQNYRELIENSVKQYGDKTAFLSKQNGYDQKITYYQFKQDIDSMILILKKYKLVEQKIGLISENRYEWCVMYLAIVLSNNIVVPFDKLLTKQELSNLMTTSNISAIFFSEKQEKTILEITTSQETEIKYFIDFDQTKHSQIVFNYQDWLNKGKQLLNYHQEDAQKQKIDPSKTSILLYTSGTTGNPKGVMLSQSNICTNLIGIQKIVKIHFKDRFLSILPLHHTYEATLGFLLPISKGACIYFSKGYRNFYQELKEYKPSVIMAVPLIYEKILRKIEQERNNKKKRQIIGQKILECPLRMLYSGAALLDKDMIKKFQTYGLNLYQVYGLTENSPVISIEGKNHRKIGSVGKVLSNIDYKILSPNEKGIGEIAIKGPSVMKGYEGNKKETNQVLNQGWLLTGDLGYIDQKGYVYIIGRKKNVIIAPNGENVYPEEIESFINQIPYIKESIVYEDKHQICAKIILEKQYRNQEKIRQKVKEEIQNLNQNLQKYKRIKNIIISKEELKRTSTNKIKRKAKI